MMRCPDSTHVAALFLIALLVAGCGAETIEKKPLPIPADQADLQAAWKKGRTGTTYDSTVLCGRPAEVLDWAGKVILQRETPTGVDLFAVEVADEIAFVSYEVARDRKLDDALRAHPGDYVRFDGSVTVRGGNCWWRKQKFDIAPIIYPAEFQFTRIVFPAVYRRRGWN